MDNIQAVIDSGNNIVQLPNGEFKGTIFINRPCTVVGRNTTIWCDTASALVIKSAGVTVRNLRVELTSKNNPQVKSIVCESRDTVFENVEIFGDVQGINGEEGTWCFPMALDFKTICADKENTFKFEIYAPVKARLSTNVKGVELNPAELVPGKNTITIKAYAIKSGTFLYGEIFMESTFRRRIYVNGSASAGAEQINNKYLFYVREGIENEAGTVQCEEAQEDIIQVVQSAAKQQVNKQQSVADIPLAAVGVHEMLRGERMQIDDMAEGIVEIKCGYASIHANMDIDPYVFMLDSSKKTTCDEDLVFFGNTKSNCGGVIYNDNGSEKRILIDFPKVSPQIQCIVVAYSVYDGNMSLNFSKVTQPYILFRSGNQERIHFVANGLSMETTLIFTEIYRYNGGWRVSAVGRGYKDGLKRLCESCGLIVRG